MGFITHNLFRHALLLLARSLESSNSCIPCHDGKLSPTVGWFDRPSPITGPLRLSTLK